MNNRGDVILLPVVIVTFLLMVGAYMLKTAHNADNHSNPPVIHEAACDKKPDCTCKEVIAEKITVGPKP